MKYFLALLLVIIFSTVEVAQAHPCEDYIPSDLPEGYGEGYGYPQEYNTGDLVFTQDFPEPYSLTPQEQYIVAGAEDGPNGALRAWWHEVYMLLLAFETQNGYLPDAITPEVIAAVSADGNVSPERLEMLKSPLTGDYPRTDADYQSPGDVYCRFLTKAEMQHLGEVNRIWGRRWFEKEDFNPKTGELERLKVVSRPVILRIYGWNGLIYEAVVTLSAGRAS